MNSPFTAMNTAAISAEATDRRRIAMAWITAAAIAVAAVTFARMGLTLALDLPDIMARAAAEQAM